MRYRCLKANNRWICALAMKYTKTEIKLQEALINYHFVIPAHAGMTNKISASLKA